MNDELEAVFRQEVGRCTATLIRVLGDIDAAEDAVAEAFTIAASRWPIDGVPPNPGAWITTTARNRAIDQVRRESKRAERHLNSWLLHERDRSMTANPDLADLDALTDVVPDDQLRLLFLCCHPALSPDAQTALTLRLLGGLDVSQIAHSFLVTEATMNKRIGRAKRKLRDNHASYRIPNARELPDRLNVALTAIYLLFTEAHTATIGTDLNLPMLSNEAIRLARIVTQLMPDEPEAAGLLGLLLLTDARRVARVDADGRMIRLSDQNRTLWDQKLITEGHDLVRSCLRRNHPGPFQIQAAIAAVHADAATYSATDWSQIIALYDQLLQHRPNSVVALNRAIAIAEQLGPHAGLESLEDLADDLHQYRAYHAAKADLLHRAHRPTEADDAYRTAIALSTNGSERAFLIGQSQRVGRYNR